LQLLENPKLLFVQYEKKLMWQAVVENDLKSPDKKRKASSKERNSMTLIYALVGKQFIIFI
jgi:hypothetical protein